MKQGLKSWNLNILSDEDARRVHDAALSLLQDPGIFSESDLFLDIFQKGGARVDRDSRVIRVPSDMVDAALRSAPRSFRVYGRHDPDNDVLLEPGRVYYGMGGTSEPHILDYGQMKPRRPTKADMVMSTRLGHAMPNIDIVQALCMSGDVTPSDVIFYHDYDAILRNTTKPGVISLLERPFTVHCLELVAAASGGEEELRQRPSILAMCTPITPLKIGVVNEGLVDVVQAGVPVLYSPGTLMGASGPATVAGALTLVMAEQLFGIVLTQLIKPGAPVVLKPDTNVFDMRTSQCTYGSPEQTVGKMAQCQLARMYGLPTWGIGGGVEAKVPDAEAAAEAMMNMLLVAQAGMTVGQSLGTLAWGLYGSQEFVVISDQLVDMVKRILSGIVVTDDTLGLEAIREVGHGGSFLSHEHTVRHFRQEMFFPQLFRRQTIQQWLDSGAQMIHEVAHERVVSILDRAAPIQLPGGADAEMERVLNKAVTETIAAKRR
jgi:trimethylamine--corrinoid protein Co-methyltransferase